MAVAGIAAEAGPAVQMDSTIYVRNLCALWQFDASLASTIEAVHPEDLPPLEPARGEDAWTVRGGGGKMRNAECGMQNEEQAARGPNVAASTRNLKPETRNALYLHSRYRPLQEADGWAAALDSGLVSERYVVVVSGWGLGYHVKALFDRLAEDALVLVAEPDITLLKAALRAVDVSAMLATGRVLIFAGTTALDRGAIVERLESRGVLFTAGRGTLFAAHGPSVQVAGAFHGAFQKLITEFVAYTRTGFVTLMLNNVATCRNVANNLGRYATCVPFDLLHNAFAGKPAVLVAAGPSLAKNMHLLHELAGTGREERSQSQENGNQKEGQSDRKSGRRAVIIAVQTMLKPLLAAGIEPDFVTSLDYNTVSTRFFENLREVTGEAGAGERVHLVAEAKAHWNVLDVFASADGPGGGRAAGTGGGGMSVIHNDFAAQLLRDAAPPRSELKPGATVAHLSFYLAEFLGCDPIILVGQDLGFVDGLYYKPGTAIHETWGVELGRFNSLETKEWERIARSRKILRKIPDIHGNDMYTEEQFFVYLQQFERDFAACRARVIDATEGGACKQHVTTMTLREAIDRFAPAPMAAENDDRVDMPWRRWRGDLPGGLERAVEAVRARQAETLAMKETCAATVPLLREMLEHQADAAKMNALFAEIDRVRGKVGQDSATFEMVSRLNTIGEMRRFQADLGVKTAEKESCERQRRQLLRDIDYVSGLQAGAERLLEILDEALRRLQRQLAAARAGKPWPREVAGA